MKLVENELDCRRIKIISELKDEDPTWSMNTMMMANFACDQKAKAVMNRIKDYLQLVKLSLSIMVVFSSVISYMLTQGFEAYEDNWWMILLLFAGGMLVTGSANAINQVVEKDTDAMMKRTGKTTGCCRKNECSRKDGHLRSLPVRWVFLSW